MSKESKEIKGLVEKNSRRSPIVRSWQWLLHLGFRLLYNELAWTYDSVSWLVSLGHWQDWGKASLAYVRGPNVLELAHGPGHMQLALYSAGFQIYGIDQSPQMSRLARHRLNKETVSVRLVRGEAQYLPYRALFFDSVVATFPTEFIIDPNTLANIRRVLKPGGRLVVVVEGRLLGRGPIYRFIEWLFDITGQRQVPGQDEKNSDTWMNVDRRMDEVGFAMDLKQIRNKDSEVIIVVASKLG